MRSLLMLTLLTSPALAEWHWGERWNHAEHAQQLASKSRKQLECHHCHQLDGRSLSPLAVGKDNHKPCLDCHGGAQFMPGNRCLTCHSSVSRFRPGRPWFPPWRSPNQGGEFHTTFPHAKHVAATSSTENCGGCHANEEGRRGAPGKSHAACGTCHAGKAQPDMNFCDGCHVAGPAPPPKASPWQEVSIFRVKDRFDHAAHAAKAKRTSCSGCHLGLAAQEPPGRPNMQTCEGCHDGKSAFDARGTQCGKCHVRPSAMSPAAPMPATQRPFRHGSHNAMGVQVEACTVCHGSGMDWRAVQPGHNDHKPCTQCHAAEYRMVGQPICLNCHERNDPFPPNPLRPPAPATSEWRLGEVPHPPHVAAKVSCETCHSREAGKKGGNIVGHSLCGQCHKSGATTTLSDCHKCHVSVAIARAASAKRPWSTRDRFPHDESHRPRGCPECHLKEGSPDLVAPSMTFCAEQCHDGKKAFKVTGFGCFRCHGAKS